MNVTGRNMPSDYYMPCQQHLLKGKQFNDKFSDDGYGTDSRSSVTASISSPLSSSLSSLSPREGSPKSGTAHSDTPRTHSVNQATNQASNMQPGPIRKGHNLHGTSRANVYKNSGLPVKRQSVKVEEPENGISLEDRLRALTIIEEEDTGLSLTDRATNAANGTHKIGLGTRKSDPQNPISCPINVRHGKITVENKNFDKDSNYTSACYLPLPVAISAADPSYSSYHLTDEEIQSSQTRVSIQNVYHQREAGISPRPHAKNGEGLKNYKRLFDKDGGIPAHNIDEILLGKLSGSDVNDVLGKNLHRQTTVGSPPLPTTHDLNLCRSDEPVFSESMHKLTDQRGREGGLHEARVGRAHPVSVMAINTGTGHSSDKRSNLSAFHSVSSVPDPELYDQSHMKVFEPLSHNQTLSLQGAPFQDQLQQEKQHSQYAQQQFSSHKQPCPDYVRQPYTPPMSAVQHMDIEKSYITTKIPPSSICREDVANYKYQSSQGCNPDVLERYSENSTPVQAPVDSNQSSWQPNTSFDQRQLALYTKLNNKGLDRSSLDLGNIQNLQRQIRATSELSLQDSRKLTFASSADIRKLFSGQNKPSACHQMSSFSCVQADQKNQTSSNVHFSKTEKTCLGSSLFVQDSFRSNPKLRVVMPPVSARGVSSSPIRADHGIHIPPEAWTNVTSLPNSASSEVDRIHFQMQNQPRSHHNDLDKPVFQRSFSANADIDTDRTHFHGLSSGYSSETEMQQIESNAEAIKKLFQRQREVEMTPNNLLQEFLPLNRSIDLDSNTDTDITENELIYENSELQTVTGTKDSLNQQLHSARFSQKPPHLQHSLESYGTQHPLPPAQKESLTRSQNFSSSSDVFAHVSDTKNISNTGYPNSMYYQNQDINFTNKHHILAAGATSHPNYIPVYNFGTNQSNNTNLKDLSVLTEYGSQSTPVSPTSYSTQYNHYSPDLLCNNVMGHDGSGPYSPSKLSVSHGNQIYLQGSHLDFPQRDTRSDVKLSPVKNVRMLEIPFETHIICDERGERLSTLV